MQKWFSVIQYHYIKTIRTIIVNLVMGVEVINMREKSWIKLCKKKNSFNIKKPYITVILPLKRVYYNLSIFYFKLIYYFLNNFLAINRNVYLF